MYDPDNDGYDFPPAAHPWRELTTFAVAAVIVVGLIVWGIVALIRWL